MTIVMGLLLSAAAVAGGEPATPGAPRSDVVFVCAHGNVKSLVASEWFNRRAGERGIRARSVARGLTPENPVPAQVAERLRRDGMDVAAFEARRLAPADLGGASRLVLIGVEAPSWATRDGLEVVEWKGIPPASESYEASRDAMRERIETLLDGLPKAEPPR
jgi:protein-tyrosine-phosphatase